MNPNPIAAKNPISGTEPRRGIFPALRISGTAMQRAVRQEHDDEQRPENRHRLEIEAHVPITPEPGSESVPEPEHVEEEGGVVGWRRMFSGNAAANAGQFGDRADCFVARDPLPIRGVSITSKPIRPAACSMSRISSRGKRRTADEHRPDSLDALSYCRQHVADDHDVLPGIFDAGLGERGRGQGGQTVHLGRQIAAVPARKGQDPLGSGGRGSFSRPRSYRGSSRTGRTLRPSVAAQVSIERDLDDVEPAWFDRAM